MVIMQPKSGCAKLAGLLQEKIWRRIKSFLYYSRSGEELPQMNNQLFVESDLPEDLRVIPELDFLRDLIVDPLADSWFLLGAWTFEEHPEEHGVGDVVFRQTILIPSNGFNEIYEKLESVGNTLHGLGKPTGNVTSQGSQKLYRYEAFHDFDLGNFIRGEPLVFRSPIDSSDKLSVNQDPILYFELEERSICAGLWWDKRLATEVIRRRIVQKGNCEIVEMKTKYLLKYLRARQMSLLVGHYRHLHLYEPSEATIASFKKEDCTLGSSRRGVKALFQNWGLRTDITTPFLQRRLHLWFRISPPRIDIEDPWLDEPPFDPFKLTFPTARGPVAPARWKSFARKDSKNFDGITCDFMDRIYFRQEVLGKYEGTAGFRVTDDGSVSCGNYWGLTRSTSRVGNDLISTAIGDFAEGVPFEEWSHWKQYVVEPPSFETLAGLREEETIPSTVNYLSRSMVELNSFFRRMSGNFETEVDESIWDGSLDSVAGRQLKWIYPNGVDDDEFLKRSLLLSTFIIEGLASKIIRKVLEFFGENLHQDSSNPPKTLGSRNLLQRLVLVITIISEMNPKKAEIPSLIKVAEGGNLNGINEDVVAELRKINENVRNTFSPLASLYDLRTAGGLAHPPSKCKVREAVQKLGLPSEKWRRGDFMRLVDLVRISVTSIANRFREVAEMRLNL